MIYRVINHRLIVATPEGETVGWVERTGDGVATFFMLNTLKIPVRTYPDLVSRLIGLNNLEICPARIGGGS